MSGVQEHKLQPGLSLYLDLLRFLLATVVLLCHATYRGYVGHPFLFWFMAPYSQTAVVGFFVLSGFVIAHVASGRESQPRIYAAARMSRLYSVVIPALLLTAFLDGIGSHFNPVLYSTGPEHLQDHQLTRYLASFFFLQRSALFSQDMSPGTNIPFWSLQMEGCYYLVFGLFLLRRPLPAVIGSIIALGVAGFVTTALFPCWLLGVLIYRIKDKVKLRVWVAAAAFVATALAIAAVGWLRHDQSFADRHDIALKYAESLLFSAHIFAAARAAPLLQSLLGWAGGVVRWLGGLTFALYLCHVPLLLFFTTFRLGAPGSAIQDVWLFGMVAMVTIFMAELAERLRRGIRRALTMRARPVLQAPA